MGWIEETLYKIVDKVPDVVIPGDDPLDRVTDHIDIDWHVQVKPEWCKNEDTEGRSLDNWFGCSCRHTHTAIILADQGIAHLLASYAQLDKGG